MPEDKCPVDDPVKRLKQIIQRRDETGKTPRTISPQAREFCEEICPGSEPFYVEVQPVLGARVSDCHLNVPQHIEATGEGVARYGWIIWELPDYLIEAEFHCNYEDRNGRVIDITPKQDGEEQVLFLPDPVRRFRGERVENIRRSLIHRVAADVPGAHATAITALRRAVEQNNDPGVIRALMDVLRRGETSRRLASSFFARTRPVGRGFLTSSILTSPTRAMERCVRAVVAACMRSATRSPILQTARGLRGCRARKVERAGVELSTPARSLTGRLLAQLPGQVPLLYGRVHLDCISWNMLEDEAGNLDLPS